MSGVMEIGQQDGTAAGEMGDLAGGPRRGRSAAPISAAQLLLDLRGQRRLRRLPVGNADGPGQARLN